MHDPKAAGGSENAIILIASTRAGSPFAYTAIIPASPKESNAKNEDNNSENPVDNRIMCVTFSFPAPISSETNLLVEMNIFPLASTIIKPNSEKISVITPTEAVPSLFEMIPQ